MWKQTNRRMDSKENKYQWKNSNNNLRKLKSYTKHLNYFFGETD